MAITHFLLQSNFINCSHFGSTTKWHNSNIGLKSNYYSSSCFIKCSPKFNIKCFITNPKSEVEKNFGKNLKRVGTDKNGVIWRSMENAMRALQISVTAGVLSCLLFRGRLAMAASGGRMGGSSFSSSSSSSSTIYSSPSSSSSYYSSGSSWSSSPTSSSLNVYNTQISSPPPMKVTRNGLMTIAVIVVVLYFSLKWSNGDTDSAKISVVKLQVGSLGTGRLLQKDLNRIAKAADTSNSKGVHSVLQESILAMLRHSEYCISGYSFVNVNSSIEGCEKEFNQISVEERGKFDEETLVNVNNIKKKSATSQSSNGIPNEYIVVTIIVAARGVPQLPPIKSSAQLKEALQKLASIPSSNIMGAEVLWTPQKEDDSLTEQEMLEDYPRLHPL